MNIFFLSVCIRRCARYHFDKHVIKMIIELTQLLSVAYHILEPKLAKKLLSQNLIYKPTHPNHSCAKWVREHVNNYNWTLRLAKELCNEWRYRWNHPNTRRHKCEFILDTLQIPPKSIPKYKILKTKDNPHGFTLPMFQAMPDECKCVNNHKVVHCQKAYRTYYKSSHKSHLTKWKSREKPYWW